MAEPIILVVETDPATLGWLGAVLGRRFGPDYQVLTESSPASALARIGQECGRGAQVALVIVGVTTPEMTDLEWLDRVQCPRASRCAVVHYGDGQLYPMFRRALLLGQVDTYIVQPQGNPEERLFPVVSEILGAWARAVRPGAPVLRIVGEQWAARSPGLPGPLDPAGPPSEF